MQHYFLAECSDFLESQLNLTTMTWLLEGAAPSCQTVWHILIFAFVN